MCGIRGRSRREGKETVIIVMKMCRSAVAPQRMVTTAVSSGNLHCKGW